MRRRNNPNWGAKLRNIFLILLYNVEKYDFLTCEGGEKAVTPTDTKVPDKLQQRKNQ